MKGETDRPLVRLRRHLPQMEFNRAGQVKTSYQIRNDRKRAGFCESCQIDPVQCYEFTKGIFGTTKKIPLTIPGQVFDGKCLKCHPNMAPAHWRVSNESDKNDDRASFVRPGGARNFHTTPPARERYLGNGHHDIRREQEHGVEDEMVHETITNVMGQTLTVLRSKKKVNTSGQVNGINDVDNDHRTNLHRPISPEAASHDHLLNHASDYGEQKSEEDEDDETLDVLGQMVRQHLASRQEAPRMDPTNFIPGAELIPEIQDDASALTMPTVFVDDGTVASRSKIVKTNSQNSNGGGNNISTVREPSYNSTSQSGSGSHRSLSSHELHEPAVPHNLDDIYLHSADESSPHIDVVRDIVSDCTQNGNDEGAIEVVRQALTDTDSSNLAIFCLTTLWVLIRKSDENRRIVLHGSRNEETPDDETPFGAIINVMINFELVAEIQTRGCGVIWSLSMNPDDRKDVAQLGGCQVILQAMLMHTNDESLQVMALGALKVLSFSVVGQSTLRQISASSVVAANMSRHIKNPTIQSEGCTIICNLATGPNHFMIAVTAEEINAIVNSIISHPESASIQEMAMFALMNLSSSLTNVELMRRNAKLYEALELAFSKNPDVVGEDVQVLCQNLKAQRQHLK